MERIDTLEAMIRSYDRVVVAFSGGVDSTYLAAVAYGALGNRAEAITGLSASVPEAERDEAIALAKQIGIRHRLIETHEMERPGYVENSPMRCFHCKDELYGLLGAIAAEANGAVVVDGTNADDVGDWRPGRKAAELHGVRSPLLETGFTKAEIREASLKLGLPTWDKPAMACLASRIPHGTPVTVGALDQVGAAEAVLRAVGMRQVRVRHHGEIARIETDAAGLELAMVAATRERIVGRLQSLGFRYVTLDLGGYRQGNMNAAGTEGDATVPTP
ncbi:MAG: ATP-dependent sacrificial sulfur transferase LarE [Dehalococcoidia bacterium]|nr:ATP-dependent sacrificial sulfur transferase LarE [Dehalococcoidia bacterium]